MSESGDARSWFEGIQQILGMSVGQLFGMLAPAGLARWFLVGFSDPEGDWPDSGPLTWLASVLEASGLSGTWALDLGGWITDRGGLFTSLLIAAAILTALSNQSRHPSAVLGLACIVYAAALESRNSVWTLVAYLVASGAFCLAAILLDLVGDPDRSGYMSHPQLSLIRWFTSVAVVAFSWITLPFMILVFSVEAYRIEEPATLRAEPAGSVPSPGRMDPYVRGRQVAS